MEGITSWIFTGLFPFGSNGDGLAADAQRDRLSVSGPGRQVPKVGIVVSRPLARSLALGDLLKQSLVFAPTGLDHLGADWCGADAVRWIRFDGDNGEFVLPAAQSVYAVGVEGRLPVIAVLLDGPLEITGISRRLQVDDSLL